MKIVVDSKKCIGCSLCEDITEGAMGTSFGKNGKASANPSTDLKNKKVVENVELAIESCPVQAISLKE